MNSPFEQVGFNMTPQFQTMQAYPPVAMPQAMPQSMPAFTPSQVSFATNPVPAMPQPALQSQPSDDQFVRESNPIDIDVLKAEIKEELRKEMEAEKAAEQKAEAKKTKKGPIRAVKDFIGTIKKFNTTAAEYIKGTFKGVASGAIIGTAAYGAFSLAKKPGMAKAFGVIGALGALGVNLWQASLKANAQRSIIDHSWGESTPIVNK